jgi:hypothetical protein
LAALFATSCVATAWWVRPLPDSTTDNKGPQRSKFFASKYSLTDHADEPPNLIIQLTSQAVIFVTVCVARSLFYLGGDFSIVKDEDYHHFLKCIKNRDPGVSVLTVSNHRSLVDDPAIFSSILPFWMNIQPRYLRWSVCSQEYCFNPKVLYFTLLFINEVLNK